jgi:hypothetical protein
MSVDIRGYIVSKFPEKSPNEKGKIHTSCPFHDDKTKSFSIDAERGLFICGSTSCGVRGSFPLFYKLMEGLVSWREVYDRLHSPSIAADLNVLFKNKPEAKKKLVVNDFPMAPFTKPIQADEIEYLRDRGISDEIVDLFGIVYGRDGEFDKVDIHNTLVVPIFDLGGLYRTFQARRLYESSLRWVTPLDGPVKEVLYGGWLVSGMSVYMPRQLWIVEGVSDVWNMQAGGCLAVGLFSKEASAAQLNQIALLCKTFELDPVACLDGDAPDANRSVYKEMKAYGLNSHAVYLRSEEDPGSLSQGRILEIRESIEKGVRDAFN